MLVCKRLSGLLLTLVATVACSSVPSEPSLDEQLFVEPASAALSAVGDSVTLQVVRHERGGNKSAGCNNPRWRSEDDEVAIVRGNGKIVAKGVGVALIIATCEPLQAAATVQVEATTRDDYGRRAFPEAEGYGAESLNYCSRSDLRVARVTNLGDSGPGSFREAVAQENGNSLTVVTFDVAGYIDLERTVEIRRGCVYVAGQTAPGDGITLRRYGIRTQNDAHDVVIRFLRVRPGYHPEGKDPVPVNVRAGLNIILDHLSVSWSGEKLIMITRRPIQSSGPISRLTVQRSLVAEPLAAVPVGMNISGQPYYWEGSTPPGWMDMSDMSIHHNLFASSHHRNPNVAAMGVEVVNNLVYNWAMDAGKGILGARADWVNNYLKPGPMFNAWRYELGYKCENAVMLPNNPPSLYFSGNVGPRNSDPTANPWTGDRRMLGCYNDRDGTALDLAWKRDTRLPQPSYPVIVQAADAAYANVLGDVGANRGLKCDGTWRSRPDLVDQRLLDDVRNGAGPSQPPVTVDDAGGFPNLAAGLSCADGDFDGLPDEYESRYGLNPNNPDDGLDDSDGDGYTNLEEYVNGSKPI